MTSNYEKFHHANGTRRILVVEDELINQEMLKINLEDGYDLLFAETGTQALQLIRENPSGLSLILLDIHMPEMDGLELLKILKSDKELGRIPVIMMTSDAKYEVESLNLGAIDFIPKPYPRQEVIRARVFRTIELSEDRQIIRVTERDSVTGLYNKEYFYRYADQLDKRHAGQEMDAIVVDVNHFHMLNERFGKAFGDEVLRRMGGSIKKVVEEGQGIACRQTADTFLLYCPNGLDYNALLETIGQGMTTEGHGFTSRGRLRMGIYPKVDRSIDMERRFDRAKLAADKVRSNYSQAIAFYDNTLHESELYCEQLLDDFPTAIAEHQFTVYYQPKYDIRAEKPVLASAEALIRWKHPRLGMISPGVFVPLFESNGLIMQLDAYVWREAARQIREWRDSFGISIPVSVNVSRVDMHNPRLVEIFSGLLQEYNLSPHDYHLEITESAYTQDSDQIIEMVRTLRSLGFSIEMDDFGTGYSSLNMLSTLPIDSLKLDMNFIRNAFGERKDVRMIELIIDIADYLHVPVIAEGVETEEQLKVLKGMGCDYVQGYYFSKPVPPDEFERFIAEKAEAIRLEEVALDEPFEAGAVLEEPGNSNLSKAPFGSSPADKEKGEDMLESMTYSQIAKSLARDYIAIYYVDVDTGHYMEYTSNSAYKKLGLKKRGTDFFGQTRKDLWDLVYPEDKQQAFQIWDKDYLLGELEKDDCFTTTYRMFVGGDLIFVNIKVMLQNEGGTRHIVVGISNVDAQMKREKEFAEIRYFALVDALTGVKNMRSFKQATERINKSLENGKGTSFGVVICDINNLKQVNDTYGHAAGDECIRLACQRICHIFQHSPVYRIGGDEFAIILRGEDYLGRDALMSAMQEKNKESKGDRHLEVAVGIGIYEPGTDKDFSAVFEKADKAMYANKEAMKRKQ